MTGWLDGAVVTGVIGADLASSADATVLGTFAAATRSYVEDRRPDLFIVDPDDLEAPPVFTPPAHVVTAAAMLAYRTYQNRTKPESEIADLADLRAMLGIGASRGLRFGGAAT